MEWWGNSYQFEAPATDPFRSSRTLILHGDGANGSTSIIDTSPTPKTITRFGSTQISTAQSKFGGSSMLYNGTTDYLTIPGNAEFDIRTQPFCIEMWIYRTASAFQNLMGYNTQSATPSFWDIGIGQDSASSNKVVFRYNGNTAKLVGSTNVTINTWNHIAATGDGTTLRIYLNKNLEASAVASIGNVPNTGALAMGRNLYGSGFDSYFSGYIDEVAFTKGVALIPAQFAFDAPVLDQ